VPEKTTLNDIAKGLCFVQDELDKVPYERKDIIALLLLICHFCSSRSTPKEELMAIAKRELWDFDFSLNSQSFGYESSRTSHRKNLKGFLTPKYSQIKSWQQWLKKAGFKDDYKGLDKLGGKHSEKAAMGYEFIKVIFCLSAKLNHKTIDKHVFDFITEYSNHNAWSRGDKSVTEIIEKYMAEMSEEIEAEELKRKILELVQRKSYKQANPENIIEPVQHPKYNLEYFDYEEYYKILPEASQLTLKHISFSLRCVAWNSKRPDTQWGGAVFWTYIYKFDKYVSDQKLFRENISSYTQCAYRTLENVCRRSLSASTASIAFCYSAFIQEKSRGVSFSTFLLGFIEYANNHPSHFDFADIEGLIDTIK
jgi:hypothetical protein